MSRSSFFTLEPRILFDASTTGTAEAIDHDANHADLGLAFNAPDPTPEPLTLERCEVSPSFTPDVADIHPADLILTDSPIQPVAIYVVDASVPDKDAVLSSLDPDAVIIEIGAGEDGVEVLTRALGQYDNVDSLHIFSHGTDGSIHLGSTVLSSESLTGDVADSVTTWQPSFTEHGDILIYGCDVAQTDTGRAFVQRLADLTGADVAASTDATGSADRDGNWDLEYATGAIEAKHLVIAGFDGLLENAAITDIAPQTIVEGSSLSFTGLLTVTGGDSDMIVEAKLESGSGGLSSNGGAAFAKLSAVGDLNAINAFLNGLAYVPGTDSNASALITVRVDQNSSEVSDNNANWDDYTSVTVNISPVADPPVLSGNATLAAVAEDSDPVGDTVSTLFGSLFNDVDSDTLSGIAISGDASAAGQGVWEYKIGTGGWTPVGSVSATNALLLNSSTLLRFNPADNYHGTPGSLTVRAIDSSTSRTFSTVGSPSHAASLAGTDISATNRSLGTSISAVNDAPTTEAFSLTVTKNVTLTGINLTAHAADVDGGTNATTDAAITSYKVIAIPDPAHGILQKSDGTALSANTTLTIAEASALKFVPVTNYTGAASFTFQALDAAGAASEADTVTVTVETFNEPPAVTVPTAQTVTEDTSAGLTISGISVADLDAGASPIEVTVSTNHEGAITLSSMAGLTLQNDTTNGSAIVTVQGTLAAVNTALNNLRYDPALNFNGDETITVAVTDLVAGDAKTDSDTITVTVTPVDDAPTMTGPAALTAVNEDTLNPAGATVLSLVSPIFSDVDGDSLAGIAISANTANSANGVWQYSVNGGVTWTAVGTVSAESALLLNTTAKLRFVPAANWSGTPAGLAIYAIDDSGSRTFSSSGSPQTTNVSGGVGISTASQILGTSVIAVNDLFQIVTDKSATVAEGGTVTIGSSTLQITDVEASASQIVYTITSLPTASGTLQKSGAALSVGSTFTQDDINTNRITFVHNGTEPSVTGASLAVGYSVTDEVGGLGTSANRSLTINVSAVNDAPVLTIGSAVVTQGTGQTLGFTSAILSVSDPDNSNAQLVFRLESLPTQGTLTISGAPVAIGSTFSYADVVAGTVLVYTHSGGAVLTDTFSVSLRDGAGGVVGATPVSITIDPVNTAPTITGTQVWNNTAGTDTQIYLSLDEGGTGVTVFPNTTFSDAQTTDPANLTIQILTLPNAAEATLKYDGTAITQEQVTAGFTFAAANKGLLTIDHVSAEQENPPDVSFTIKVTDDDATSPLSREATVNVELQAINDDPVGTAGSRTIDAGDSVTITTALLNATDVDTPDSDLTFTLETRPAHGYLYLNGVPLGEGATFTIGDITGNLLTYTHDGTALADDSFAVTLRDGEGGSFLDGNLTPLVVTFLIDRPGEDIPAVARTDQFSMLENIDGDIRSTVFTAGQLLANDSGNAPLAIVSVQATQHCTALLSGDGQTITFTPDTGFEGEATFDYTIQDQDGDQSTATVTVQVYGIDAVADTFAAQLDTPLVLTTSQLTANDTGNNPLSITGVGTASHGTVTLVGNVITYTPTTGYKGYDSFSYTLTDADGDTDTTTVTIDVQPVAVDDAFAVLENTQRTFTPDELLGDDRGTGLSIVRVAAGDNTTSVGIDGSGDILFTPGNAEAGTATFTYTIRDANGNEDTATVTVTVYDLDARNDSFSTPKNTALILTEEQLLANDSGNPAMSITNVQTINEPDYSVAWDDTANAITVTPINDYSGPITFTYTLTDGDGETDTATVTVNVTTEPNQAPTAANDAFVTYEDTPLSLTEAQLTGNDSGDAPLNIVSVQGASNCTVALVNDTDGDGYGDTVLFTPDANFAGTASFTYTIRDATTGDTATSTATVTVMVLARNDSPVLTTGTQTGFDEGSVVAVSSAALDTSDVDNTDAQLVYTLTELPDKSTQPEQYAHPGKLYYDASPLTGIYDSSTPTGLASDVRELRINDTFSQADLDAGRIKFAHDGGETHTSTFKFTVTDGSEYVLSGTATLQDTPVNDRPHITGTATADRVLVNEGYSVVIDEAYIRSSDVDRDVDGTPSDTLTLRVTILPTHGTLRLDTNGDGTFDTEITEANKATTTFTQAQIDAGRLQYTHDGGEDSSDSFIIEVNDNSSAGNATNTAEVQIGIIGFNDDPTLVLSGTATIYEGQQQTIHTADLLDAEDEDNSDDQLQFRITASPAHGCLVKLDIVGETLQETGVVLCAGSVFTQAELDADRIVYRHDGSEADGDGATVDDSFSYTISDAGGGEEPKGTLNIIVNPINDAPTIEAPASLSGTEDQPIAITGIVIDDPDAYDTNGDVLANFPASANMMAVLTVASGTLNVTATDSDTDTDADLPTLSGNGSDTLTITGNLADINATLATLTYTGTLNFVGNDTINITVKDGGNTGTDPDLTGSGEALEGLVFNPALTDDGSTDTTLEQAAAAIAITVNAANDAPVNTVPSAQSVNEDTALVFSTANNNAITFDDPDVADGGSYTATVTLSVLHGTLTATADGSASVSGSGTATLTLTGSQTDINNTLDGLSYQGIADYYGPDTLTMVTSDLGNFGLGGVKTDTDTIGITVTPVNDAPTSSDIARSANEDATLTFTLPSSDVGANSVVDHQTTDRFSIVTIPDYGTLKDSEGNTLSAGATITVAQATSMTFTPDANFNGQVSFTYKAVDSGDLESAVQTATITVNAVNDAPEISGLGDSVAYTEGNGLGAQGTPVLLDANHDMQLVRDIELTERSEDTFNSSTLTVRRNGGAVSVDRFGIDTTTAIGDGQTVAVASGVVSVGGTAIGTITNDSSSGTLVVTFNASATKEAVSAVMKRITYSNVDDDLSGAITVAMTFNDGNAGAQGTGVGSATGTVTVTVTGTNDAPTLSANLAMAAIREDAGDDDGSGADGDDDATNNANNQGQTVAALVTGFADPDGGTLAGIVIVGNNSASVQGSWQYSLDGTTWTAVPTDVSTINALYLDTSDLVRFVPDQNANDTTFPDNGGTPTLTVKAVDNTTGLVSGATAVDATGGGTSAIAADSVQLTASVLPVNDTPIISDLNGDNATFTEGIADAQGTAIILDQNTAANLSDVELTINEEADFNGATLTVVDNAGADTTDFYFIRSGVNNVGVSGSSTIISGQRIYDIGSAVTYGVLQVATISDNSATSGQLVVTFNSAATSAAVNAILQNISFNSDNAALTSTTKTVNVTFNDAGQAGIDPGLTADGSSESTSALVHIGIQPTNDSPTLSAGATITAAEDGDATTAQTVTQFLGANFSDPDGVSGNTLSGVLVTGFNNQSIGEWQVSLDNETWTSLSSLAAVSESSALALSAGTFIRFDYNDNANTQGSTAPTITVHGVEALAPTGAGNTGAGQAAQEISFTTNFTSNVVRYDISTDTSESRITDDSVAITATISASNDAPVISASGSDTGFSSGVFTGTVVESPVVGIGTTVQQLLTGVAVTDLDLATTGNLADSVFGAGSITVTLTDRVTSDVFSLDGSPAGVASTSGGTGSTGTYVINLTTGATLAQVQTILEAIRYENTSDNPPSATRSYTVVLDDGNNLDADGDTAGGPEALNSNTLTGSITITGVNDPPLLSLTGQNPTFTENDSAKTLFSGASVDTVQDPADNITTITLTVSNVVDGTSEKLTIDGTEISLTNGTTPTTINSGSVNVSVSGTTATVTYTHATGLTEAQTNTLLDNLAYRHTSEDPTAGDRVVTITRLRDDGGTDGGGDDDRDFSIASTVTVVPVNDAPDLTATVGGDYTEQGTTLQFLTGVAVTDPDTTQYNSGSLTVALGAYYTGDTLSIVTGNNITLSGSSVLYSGTTIGTFSGGSETNLVINFTTTNATNTAVQALAGQIGFSSSSENPSWAGTAGTRSVTVTLNDGGNSGTTGAKNDLTPVTGTFNVIGINDAPTLTGLDTTSSNTYIQAGAAVVIDANAVLADLDLQAMNEGVGTGNWSGSTLTIARDGGASANDIFGATGSLSSIAAVSGNIVVSGTTIGTYTNSGGTLALTFSVNATTALVNTVLNSITYANAVTTSGALGYDHVDLHITFNDQNTNITDGGIAGTTIGAQDQGYEGLKTVSGTITVDINRLPVVVADTNSLSEGVATTDVSTATGNVLTGGTADSDPDSDTLAVQGYQAGTTSTVIANGVDAARAGTYGSLTMAANGAYTYTLNNANATVQALATGETLTDTFSYTADDGRGGKGTTTLTITINGTNDAPVITNGPDIASLSETNAPLSTSGSLTVSDVDVTDVVTATRTLAVSGTSNRSDAAAPSDATLLSMLTISPTTILTGAQTSNTLNWSFNSGSEAFNYLATGETLVLTYTVTATDDDGTSLSDSETVTITITGTNDAPDITVGAGDSATASLEETNATLSTSGTLTVTDVDTANTVAPSVVSVTAGGTTTGLGANNATLLTMLTVDAGNVVAADANSGKINWSFNSGSEYFNHLAAGESLTLTYTVRATDSSSGTDNQTVIITVTGTNDAPVISLGAGDSATADISETDTTLTASDTLTITDLDYSNTVAASVPSVTAIGDTNSISNESLRSMLTVSPTNILGSTGTSAPLTWAFNSGAQYFDYLEQGETLTLNYTVRVTDSSNATDDQTVTVTITGTNDVPVLTIAGSGVAELADAAAQDLSLSGNLQIFDKDVDNTLTPSQGTPTAVWSGGAVPVGYDLSALTAANVLTLGAATTSTGGTVNISWSYDPAAVNLDFLAAGQTLTITYPVTITDEFNAADTENLVVTITGTNDAPVITVESDDSAAETLTETNAGLTTSDTLTVTDLDYNDTVTVSKVNVVASGTTTGLGSNNAALLSMLTVNAGNVIDGTYTTGTINWSFNSGSEAFNYLATGETLVLTYTVRVTDSSNATDDQTITITINGTQDAPVAVADTNTTTENASLTVAAVSGVLANDTDFDETDTLTVSAVDGLAGNVGASVNGSNGGSFVIAANGSYTFNPGTAFDYLAAGESQTTSVSYANLDSNGGTSTSTLTITVNGTNDGPVVASTDVTATVTEQINPVGNLTDSGTIAFTDLDLSDTHSVSAVTPSGGALGTLNASVTNDSTGTGLGGVVSWDYSVTASAVEYLAEGETKVETFSFNVLDGKGGSVTRTVTVTITGTNDAPIAVVDTNTTSENSSLTVGANSGVLSNDTDVDLADTHSVSAVNGLPGNVGANVTGSNGGTFNVAADGSYTFDPGTAFNDLAVGESRTTSINYTNLDSKGASVTTTLTITVNGANDAPVITGGPDTASLSETNAALTTSGSLTVTDVDTTDVVTASRTLSVGGTSDRTDAAAPTDAELLAMLTITPTDILDGSTNSATLSWSFDSGTETFDYLATGETLVLTYTVQATDNDGTPLSDTETVTITITGTNDAPIISVEDGDSVGANLTESNVGLTDSGTLTVGDADLTDLVTAAVDSVAVTGTGATSVPATLTSDILKGFLSVSPTAILDGTELTNTLAWNFDSGSEAFDFLANGETLVLTYTVSATDNNGTPASDTQTVTITITGTNDAPAVHAIDPTPLHEQTDTSALNADIAVTFDDVDLTDVGHTATVTEVTPSGATTGLALDKAELIALITPGAATKASGSDTGGVTLAFSADPDAFDYLADGEVLTLTYTVQIDDLDGGQADQTFVVTITGANDAPVANPDTLTAAQNTSTTFSADQLLGNDTDVDGGELTITSVANGTGGTVLLDSAGSVTFTATEHFFGTASFSYTVSDGKGGTSTTNVTVNVPDITPPATPTVDFLSTTSPTPRLTGSLGKELVPGEILTVTVDGITYSMGDGSLVVTGTSWFLQIPPGNALVAGTYPVLARVVDPSNNISTDLTTDELTILAAPSNSREPVAEQRIDDKTGTQILPGEVDDPTRTRTSGMETILKTTIVTDLLDLDGEAEHPRRLHIFYAHRINIESEQALTSIAIPQEALAILTGTDIRAEATLQDGSPLPGWISFDPDFRSVQVSPPNDLDVTSVTVRIRFWDEKGNESIVSIVIKLDKQGQETPAPLLLQWGASEMAGARPGQEIVMNLEAKHLLGLHGETLRISATLTDGSPLPDWLHLEPGTGALKGRVPADAEAAEMAVKVRITDDHGNTSEFTQQFQISAALQTSWLGDAGYTGHDRPIAPCGRQSFSAQLAECPHC